MRGRDVRGDVLWAAIILLVQSAIAAALRHVWLQQADLGRQSGQYGSRSWLIASAVAAGLFVPVPAAILGATAIPTRSETGAVQSALLTRLRSIDIVAGRLLAALLPVLMAIAVSCCFWVILAVVQPAAGRIAQILTLHLVLICVVYMVGANAALGATSRTPGRAWARGAGGALVWSALCTTGLLLVNGQLRRMNDPAPLIEAALILNPVSAAATALTIDMLRTPWVYARSDAPDYYFEYPSPWSTVVLYGGLGLTAQVWTALRLRRSVTRG